MKAKSISRENGAVMVVEAAFVFPIVFIVVLLMIVATEATYQNCRVERLVAEAVLDASARCADPTLASIQEDGEVSTSYNKIPNAPYRYILTGDIKDIANKVRMDLDDKVQKLDSLVFKGMKPTNVNVTMKTQAGIISSSLSLQCDFDIVLPFKMIFSNEEVKLSYTVYNHQRIMDPAEFVRNVSFVQDTLERTKAYNEGMEKISKALDKVAKFMN